MSGSLLPTAVSPCSQRGIARLLQRCASRFRAGRPPKLALLGRAPALGRWEALPLKQASSTAATALGHWGTAMLALTVRLQGLVRCREGEKFPRMLAWLQGVSFHEESLVWLHIVTVYLVSPCGSCHVKADWPLTQPGEKAQTMAFPRNKTS